MGDRLRYGFCGAVLEECAWAWEWNATAAMRHRQGYMGIMRRGNSAYAPQKAVNIVTQQNAHSKKDNAVSCLCFRLVHRRRVKKRINAWVNHKGTLMIRFIMVPVIPNPALG